MEGFRLNKVLNYDFEKIEGIADTDDEEVDEEECDDGEALSKKMQKKALKILALSITIMVDRVHSLNDEVPDFEEFLESKPDSRQNQKMYFVNGKRL